MTDDQLDQARADEALRICREDADKRGVPYAAILPAYFASTAARLAREGWTPPDPLLLEARRIMAAYCQDTHGAPYAYMSGSADDGPWVQVALLGVRRGIELGREQERGGLLAGEGRICAKPDQVIVLNESEVQSGYSRVRWAEGLIRQLPADHEGRNSWLLNYGTMTATEAAEVDAGVAVEPLPQDVIDLVIAARCVCDAIQPDDETLIGLGNAVEKFSARVPYENEPDGDKA